MQFLTIQQATAFLQQQPTIYGYLRLLIREYLQAKEWVLPKSIFGEEYNHLKTCSLIQYESDDGFLLDFDSLPVGYVLMEVAEEMMQEKMPLEPVAAIRFINRFALMIRQPEPQTSWYANLSVQFETFALIYLHQIHQVDVTTFIEEITKEMVDNNTDLLTIDNTYRYVFPYLNDDTGKQFATISRMLEKERTKYIGFDALEQIGRINPEKAVALYQYAKAHQAVKQEGFLRYLLIGLYHSNEDHYLAEAMELFKEDPVEGLHTITWLDYRNEKHIETAYDFIQRQNEASAGYRNSLPTFYYRLSENKNTPGRIKLQCSEKIREVTG